ncbi:MAG: biotin/lipoyl-binding protein [Chloroflexi bacterium]|nr:biotin/lipoyl-binding protein [Chloroflexota bacterium]
MVKRFALTMDGQKYEIEWQDGRVVIDGQSFPVEFPEDGVVLLDGRRYTVQLSPGQAVVDGIAHQAEAEGLDASAAAAGPAPRSAPTPEGAGVIKAIMPGKIVQVLVEQGQEVAADQVICVLEAMKMQNELRTPTAGTVAELRVTVGQSVGMGEVLAVVSGGD